MRFSLFALFVSTALVGVVSSSPTPEVNEYEARDLEPRVSLTNMVRINSAKDYCLIVPKNKRTNIGDSEHPGGMTTYCSKPQGGQGKLPSNFWKNVAYKKGKGKTGKAYVQRKPFPEQLRFLCAKVSFVLHHSYRVHQCQIARSSRSI
ncbi:hypothetical protein FRC02_002495 [Tulasnella sp. 418]|nr:hypothetical protein FRC02_002495 [Tulasnella sp. 418]